MNSYTSFSPLVEAFSATRPWYLKKNNLLYPPNILMGYGIPGNATKQGFNFMQFRCSANAFHA
jgi:hypothetical protein